MNTITKEQLDSITYEHIEALREIKKLYTGIVDALTLRQYEPCMFKKYNEFALQAKRVSKSKKIHTKADKILSLWNVLKPAA